MGKKKLAQQKFSMGLLPIKANERPPKRGLDTEAARETTAAAR